MSVLSIERVEKAVIRRALEYSTARMFMLSNAGEIRKKLIRNTNILFLLKDAPECVDTSKIECNEL